MVMRQKGGRVFAGLRRERLVELIAYNVKMFLDLLGRGL